MRLQPRVGTGGWREEREDRIGVSETILRSLVYSEPSEHRAGIGTVETLWDQETYRSIRTVGTVKTIGAIETIVIIGTIETFGILGTI